VCRSVPRAAGVLFRGTALTGAGRRRVTTLALTLTLVSAAGVLVAACGPDTAGAGGQAGTTAHHGKAHNSSPSPGASAGGTIAALRVISVSPGRGARRVDGADPVSVQFSAPLATGSPMPALRPAVPGTWSDHGAMLVFTPSVPFAPARTVTLQIPGGPSGVRGADGSVLARHLTMRFQTQGWSTLREEQLLAELHYLPLKWTPTAAHLPAAASRIQPAQSTSTSRAAQLAAVYNPPAGTFSWKSGYPATLTSQWRPGKSSLILTGAVMAFESQHGMPLNHTAGPKVWAALLKAAVHHQRNHNGYTYAVARKGSPETLTVWHDGAVVLKSLANTGIPVSPTADGTFPVYLRFVYTIMSGTNPDGSHYADPVWWVSYFNGGDAVHYFPRGSYGFPQSLGCVELPWAQAKRAYPYLTYGSLVSVVD
jgi:L,D-transpeptidase catalytic domain/Bacterial Ig-like domain